MESPRFQTHTELSKRNPNKTVSRYGTLKVKQLPSRAAHRLRSAISDLSQTPMVGMMMMMMMVQLRVKAPRLEVPKMEENKRKSSNKSNWPLTNSMSWTALSPSPVSGFFFFVFSSTTSDRPTADSEGWPDQGCAMEYCRHKCWINKRCLHATSPTASRRGCC